MRLKEEKTTIVIAIISLVLIVAASIFSQYLQDKITDRNQYLLLKENQALATEAIRQDYALKEIKSIAKLNIGAQKPHPDNESSIEQEYDMIVKACQTEAYQDCWTNIINYYNSKWHGYGKDYSSEVTELNTALNSESMTGPFKDTWIIKLLYFIQLGAVIVSASMYYVLFRQMSNRIDKNKAKQDQTKD